MAQGERIWHNVIFPTRFNGLAETEHGGSATFGEIYRPVLHLCKVQYTLKLLIYKGIFFKCAYPAYRRGAMVHRKSLASHGK
jgi:hypothetical protein